MARMKNEHRILFDCICLVAVIIPMTLRLWSRYANASRIGWTHTKLYFAADAVVLFGFLFAPATLAADMWLQNQAWMMRKKGLEVLLIPPLFVPFDKLVPAMKISFLTQFSYLMIMWSIKAGFITYYYDLQRHFSKRLKIFLLLVSIYTAITFVILIVSTFTWCRPLSRNWNPTDFCTGQNDMVYTTFSTVCHISSDILLLCLSFTIIRSLQLGKAELYALSFIFLLGTTTLVAASLQYAITTELILEIKPHNSEFSEAEAAAIEKQYLAGVIESVIAIITVSLPSLRVLLRRLVFGKQVSSNNRGNSGNVRGGIAPKNVSSDATSGNRSAGTNRSGAGTLVTIGGSVGKGVGRYHQVRSNSHVEEPVFGTDEFTSSALPTSHHLLAGGAEPPSPASSDSTLPPPPPPKESMDRYRGGARGGSPGGDSLELRTMGVRYWPEPDEMPGRVDTPTGSVGRGSGLGRDVGRPGGSRDMTPRMGNVSRPGPSFGTPVGPGTDYPEFGYAYEVTGGAGTSRLGRR